MDEKEKDNQRQQEQNQWDGDKLFDNENDNDVSMEVETTMNTLDDKGETSPNGASNVATSSSSMNNDDDGVLYENEGVEELNGRCSSVTDSIEFRENSLTQNAQSSNDRICHLCWCGTIIRFNDLRFRDESRYPGRHIAQKHLKKPLYECPVCESFGSYESCTVAKHIMKVHPESNEQPISNLEKYADEIRDLQVIKNF